MIREVMKIAIAIVIAPGCICKEDYYNYTVVSGDSFWGIAKKVYGDGNKYPKILEYNGMTENDTIYAGDILKIPV